MSPGASALSQIASPVTRTASCVTRCFPTSRLPGLIGEAEKLTKEAYRPRREARSLDTADRAAGVSVADHLLGMERACCGMAAETAEEADKPGRGNGGRVGPQREPRADLPGSGNRCLEHLQSRGRARSSRTAQRKQMAGQTDGWRVRCHSGPRGCPGKGARHAASRGSMPRRRAPGSRDVPVGRVRINPTCARTGAGLRAAAGPEHAMFLHWRHRAAAGWPESSKCVPAGGAGIRADRPPAGRHRCRPSPRRLRTTSPTSPPP